MFSRQKPTPPKKRNHNLAQFGLTEIPDNFDPSAGLDFGHDDANDSDLEAELNALTSGGGAKPKVKTKAKAPIIPTSDLDKMIADSLRDVGSDEDDDEVDEEDLMGELKQFAGNDEDDDGAGETGESATVDEAPMVLPTSSMDVVAVIKQRLELYKLAESQAAAAGEAAKARRLARGCKTLTELLKKASAGQVVATEDIPPEVSVKPVSPSVDGPSPTTTTTPNDEVPKVPLRAAPPPPVPVEASSEPPAFPPPILDSTEKPAEDNPLLEQMAARQREYKAAALQAKRAGDTAGALQYLKVVKQFDMVMKMCADGQQVDISDMPPPPEEFAAFMAKMQTASEETAANPQPEPATTESPTTTASTSTSLLEALVERLDKYKSVEAAAKAEENTSKARRYGRIVKQYEDAIKQHKAGRALALDELPIPPGFGPLPTTETTTTSPTSPETTTTSTPIGTGTPSTESTPTGTPQPAKRANTVSPRPELTTRTSGNQQRNNLAEQQMKTLLERQREFKLAAIEAKKTGEMEQAKEYLKIYKGFDALLNAASSGLPVDLNTLPVPPSQKESLEASFAIVDADECDPNADDITDIAVRIEEQLAKQLMMCKNTRDHHKAMGDIGGMNRFENLALTVQKDLDLVRYNKRQNLPLPKFHYEKRSFNIVHCNTDLRDDELEIIVVRGINYSVPNPKEVDTYVKVEFPLLNDEFFRTKTNLIKDTNNPDYDQHFTVDIQRGNRQFQRIFKRHGVKLEVYSRGCTLNCCGLSRLLPTCCFRGFLRSDVLIGTVTVKLQPLETKCDIHDTYDLMEGRRAVGGKLEVKVRIRNPILTKQMEHINEKWLVLDS